MRDFQEFSTYTPSSLIETGPPLEVAIVRQAATSPDRPVDLQSLIVAPDSRRGPMADAPPPATPDSGAIPIQPVEPEQQFTPALPRARNHPPEIVQASIAAFAAERIAEPKGRDDYLLRNIRETAASGTQTLEGAPNDGVASATPADYAAYLREAGGSRNERIQGRAEMLEAYKEFEPAIQRLREELADPAARREHPGCIGAGTNSTIVAIEVGSKQYAVRIPHGVQGSLAEIDEHMEAGVLAKESERLEQIVAASYTDAVTVAEIMPGKHLGKLTPEEVDALSDKGLNSLLDVLNDASRRGVKPDFKPANILYDPKADFGIVDLSVCRDGSYSTPEGLGVLIEQGAGALANAGVYDKKSPEILTPEHFAESLVQYRANLGALQRYRELTASRFDGATRTTALEGIDLVIAGLQRDIHERADPQWVAEAAAASERRFEAWTNPPQTPPGGDWL